MVKLVRVILAAAVLSGCQEAALGANDDPESSPVPCVDDGKEHYGVAVDRYGFVVPEELVRVLPPPTRENPDPEPYLGDLLAENPRLSISESGSKLRIVADWDDAPLEGAWYGVVVYYLKYPRHRTWEFIEGPQVRTSDVSCYAIEAERGYRYFFAVQIRAVMIENGEEVNVGSYWIDIE